MHTLGFSYVNSNELETKKKPKKQHSSLRQRWVDLDFPGGPVVKNPPANTGDAGLLPDLGRSLMPRSNEARVPQLLSLCALEPVSCKKRGRRRGEPAHRSEEEPLLAATRESPCAATKARCSQILHLLMKRWVSLPWC